MFCGVDEAGKGAVLGPMVVAAVGHIEEEIAIPGVKDSKQLSPEKRDSLYGEILQGFATATRIIPATEIDRLRKSMTMNTILARLHAEVIVELSPDVAYVDACDVIEERYGHAVSNFLGEECRCRVVARHHADESVVLVSAASIVAKVVRDREIDILRGRYGEIGSGYPSDPLTIAYLAGEIERNGRPPDIARRSWKTVHALIERHEQRGIFDFS